MKIAILGFGLEGKSVLKYLKKSPQFKKAEVFILDKKLDKNYLKNLDKFNIIFRSPGVPYNLPKIQNAVKKGVEFSSATKIFFQESQKFPNIKIVGITGTKGKGTTSVLLYKILKACHKNVFLAGNIGHPATELLPRLSKTNPKQSAIVVLELSSFQLQDLNQSPDIAAILDVFPEHLDIHKNLKEYFNTKANIAKWQKKTDKCFYFADNKNSLWIASKSVAQKITVKINPDQFNFSNNNLKIPGQHNVKNTFMAATIALSLGCPKEKIIKIIKNFPGVEHRLELVKIIKKNPAVIKFYNDSASTNPQTTIAAINSFSGPKILIAGGKDKKLNYSPLAKALKNSDTELIILLGENKQKIAAAILKNNNQKITIKKVKNLRQAVHLAYKTAKSLTANKYPLITILFSPASASFDMFKNYEERGKKFKSIVKKI